MPVIPTGWAQAAVKFTGVNVPRGAAIVTGIENASSSSAAALASDIWDAFATATPFMCTSDVSLTSVDVKLGPNDTGAIATFAATPVPGAVGATSLSPGSAILVEKTTAFGGRRSRGRMFWPGVYQDWVDDAGVLIAGAITAVDTSMDLLLGDIQAAGNYLALLHTPAYEWEIIGGQPRRVYADPGTVPVPYRVTSLSVDTTVATQRRRLR